MPTVVLNINTKFRNNYENTLSTDFIYNLPTKIKNVTSMEYLTSEFVNVPFVVNNKLGSNNFKIIDKQNNNTEHTVVIQEGNYSGNELAEELTKGINAIGLTNHDANNKINVSFNNPQKKFVFDLSLATVSNPNNYKFDIDFTYRQLNGEGNRFCSTYKTIDEQHLSLGWLLGFRKPLYTFADDYKSTEDPNYGKYAKGFNSEGVYDRTGSRYYLLMINDFNNNHKNSIISSYQRDTMIDNNILTKIKYIVDPDYHSVDTDTTVEVQRVYPGKVDINRLQIKLLDEYGRIVDLDNMDYSISLRIEIADDETFKK